jgi:hypothetical protein
LKKDCLKVSRTRAGTLSGLNGAHEFGKAGNFSGSGFMVDATLFGPPVNDRLCFRQQGLGIFRTVFTYSQAYFLDGGFDSSPNCNIPAPANFILTGSLDCRFMISQWIKLLSSDVR